jgi:hypothetical protein
VAAKRGFTSSGCRTPNRLVARYGGYDSHKDDRHKDGSHKEHKEFFLEHKASVL